MSTYPLDGFRFLCIFYTSFSYFHSTCSICPEKAIAKKNTAYVDVAAASYSFVFAPFSRQITFLVMNIEPESNIEAISKSESDSTPLSERSDHCENEQAGSSKRTSAIIVRIRATGRARGTLRHRYGGDMGKKGTEPWALPGADRKRWVRLHMIIHITLFAHYFYGYQITELL